MSHEATAIEEYMNQQQLRINQLTQDLLLSQTRNSLLEKELISIKGYGYETKSKESPNIVERTSVGGMMLSGERMSRVGPILTTDRFKPKNVSVSILDSLEKSTELDNVNHKIEKSKKLKSKKI